MSSDNGVTAVSSRWERFLGYFVHNKLIVVVAVVLLVAAGLSASPFFWDLGGLPRNRVPVDAIPDIGENQQIVFTKWPGMAPKDVQNQLTYPLTASLLGIPGVKTVRSSSMFGFSSIQIIFEDDIEFYWSRSRVLEKLSSLAPGTIPAGVSPALGPDATALGQVYWYTLEGRDSEGNRVGGWDLHELRSIQDWTVRYGLQAARGVADVASVGGHVREYQIDADPELLLKHGVRLKQLVKAVSKANKDIGARTLEVNQVEYVVRSNGKFSSVEDIENTTIIPDDYEPIRVRDVATVVMGPAQRRGALDDGGVEAVGGVVIARYGENPMEVINAVKEKIAKIAPGLPSRKLEDGTMSQVTIVPFYDRSGLIKETLNTLSDALVQQILVTIIVVLLLLRNLRSSILISSVLPLAVLGAFLGMKGMSVDANIMALAGIAIAIGTMVDMSIVFTENISSHLESAEPGADRAQTVIRAAAEVAPAVLTSVLTTVVSFLPVFALTASEGKLFTPLALTKSFAMVAALLVSMVMLPAFAHWILVPAKKSESSWRTRILAVTQNGWRELLFVLCGLYLLNWTVLGGLALVALGVSRIGRDILPEHTRKAVGWVENFLVITVVAVLLTLDWMPLGGQSSVVNFVFVGLMIAGLLGIFLMFEKTYTPLLQWSLQNKGKSLLVPFFVVVFGFVAWVGSDRAFSFFPQSIQKSKPMTKLSGALPGFGREFMPDFDEGTFLYMPTTMPHASFGQALSMLQKMDAAILAIPEVNRAVGKLGRAETPLDPAPVSMFETVINYSAEYGQDEDGNRVRKWRDHIQSPDDIWAEIVQAASMLGLTSAPMLMPINTRIVMLQSGMRAPMGIKIRGPKLETIEAFGLELQEILKNVRGVRAETVFADRVVGKPYLEIDIDREQADKVGISIRKIQNLIEVAVGGRVVTMSMEGRARYAVRVRYAREARDSLEALSQIYVPTASGRQIPLGELAEFSYVKGPQVIKSEDTFLTSYVLFGKEEGHSDVEVVERAQSYLALMEDAGTLKRPPGVEYEFAGTYENQVRSEKKLRVLVPLAMMVVFLILYVQFRRVSTTLIIFSGVAICIAGGFSLIWLYDKPWFLDFSVLGTSMRELFRVGTVNLSVAVWVGFIALLGIATDAGVVMATYLAQRFRADPPTCVQEVHARALEAGSRRVRPCLMTTATTALALLPVLSSQGRGADVMVPMAIPSIGGMATILLTLFTVPVLYAWVEEARLKKRNL